MTQLIIKGIVTHTTEYGAYCYYLQESVQSYFEHAPEWSLVNGVWEAHQADNWDGLRAELARVEASSPEWEGRNRASARIIELLDNPVEDNVEPVSDSQFCEHHY